MSDQRPKLVFAWSTGKDSAHALHTLRSEGRYDVVGLLTTVSPRFGRVAIHGVRTDLLDRQAAAVGLPVTRVELPSPCSNDDYEAAFGRALDAWKARGVGHVGFGDLFLADIRAYRDALLARHGLAGVYPLWQRETGALARAMIASGLRAKVSALDPTRLPRAFAGRDFDAAFLADLPPGVDPCGENGEFHTFAYAGPVFDRAVAVRVGEVVERDGQIFADLLGETE